MSNATSVSDLERAEHNGTFGVKKVAVYNDDGAGNLSLQPKTATEETLQAVLAASGGSTYNYIQSETTASYKYYGYASSTGWKIKRKTLATGVWEVAEGTGDYDTNWSNRASQSYAYT
jgi:hypothetical protein